MASPTEHNPRMLADITDPAQSKHNVEEGEQAHPSSQRKATTAKEAPSAPAPAPKRSLNYFQAQYHSTAMNSAIEAHQRYLTQQQQQQQQMQQQQQQSNASPTSRSKTSPVPPPLHPDDADGYPCPCADCSMRRLEEVMAESAAAQQQQGGGAHPDPAASVEHLHQEQPPAAEDRNTTTTTKHANARSTATAPVTGPTTRTRTTSPIGGHRHSPYGPHPGSPVSMMPAYAQPTHHQAMLQQQQQHQAIPTYGGGGSSFYPGEGYIGTYEAPQYHGRFHMAAQGRMGYSPEYPSSPLVGYPQQQPPAVNTNSAVGADDFGFGASYSDVPYIPVQADYSRYARQESDTMTRTSSGAGAAGSDDNAADATTKSNMSPVVATAPPAGAAGAGGAKVRAGTSPTGRKPAAKPAVVKPSSRLATMGPATEEEEGSKKRAGQAPSAPSSTTTTTTTSNHQSSTTRNKTSSPAAAAAAAAAAAGSSSSAPMAPTGSAVKRKDRQERRSSPNQQGSQQPQQQQQQQQPRQQQQQQQRTTAERPACHYALRVRTSSYHIVASVSVDAYSVGRYVAIEGDRGVDVGQVLSCSAKSASPIEEPRQPMALREATKEEVEKLEQNRMDAEQAVPIAAAAVEKLALPMKVVGAVYQLDRVKLTFMYEAGQRVDFRHLLRELYTEFRCRIWMEAPNPAMTEPSAPQ